MKHIGKMKNNSARVVIVYRTLPGDPYSALVVGSQGLVDFHHDSLMSILESDSGQQANELADILAVRRFPDGNNMLEYLHTNGHLKKVATNMVIVMPNTTTNIPLDELNNLIAQQKGVKLDELAIIPEGQKVPDNKKEPPEEYKSKWVKMREEKAAKALSESAVKTISADVIGETVSPDEMIAVPEAATPEQQAKLYRSQADKLAKQAAEMRRKAEELVPTTKKKAKAEA
jgi:hypothetical protein